MSNKLTFKEFKHQCLQSYTVYVKEQDIPMSTKKIESLKRIAFIQHYYQCNPVRFINDFFNIELLDAQAWILTRAWNCPHVLLVCTRGFGKSTLIDLMLMAKSMLFNNYWSYICSGSSSQAQTTFTTLERLANDNIDTMVGSTGVLFKHEVVIKAASGDGFNHSNDGFSYELYNGAMTRTVNSNIQKMRGKRGNVVFDEAAFLSEEMLTAYAAFAIVNKSFKTGKDATGKSLDLNRIRAIPEEIPNQLFYISSASSTDMEYYRLYREYSKRMFMGDDGYFVALIDCEVAFAPTLHGKTIKPLLEKSTVESEMRINPEKARREYYCEFTTEAGSDAIVKRGVITRNEEVRVPVLSGDGKKKYGIYYDPARQKDNSFILVLEFYEEKNPDGSPDLRGRVVNGINLIDVGKKIKSPMQTPDQVKYLKQLILDYNAGADAYGNIVGVWIDAGSGGGGVAIADYLMPDWEDEKGNTHRGLIDKEYSEEYVGRFPNAVNKLHLMSPSKFKSIMFEAMIEMVHQNKLKLTAPYDNKGYLVTFDVDEELIKKEKKRISEQLKKTQGLENEELEKAITEELGRADTIKTKMVKLSWYEELALANIDSMKEELVNMARKKRDKGHDSFDLIPEKANKLHDDRAYCFAMAGYSLFEERRKLIMNRPKQSNTDVLNKIISSMKPSIIH